MIFRLIFTIFVFTVIGLNAKSQEGMLRTGNIRVRDPFIYADSVTGTYFLYVQAGNRKKSGYKGVEVYKSKDLKTWQPPVPVLVLPDDMNVLAVWAPEMHEYKGKYYLFVTLTLDELLQEKKPVRGSWPDMNKRGTYVFSAMSPEGLFEAVKNGSFTPAYEMALDGTLYVEDGKPYMFFCHEWVQTVDGTVDLVSLKNDLSGTAGEPMTLFRASDAPGAITSPKKGKVTDGCFLYKSKETGNLYMIWSTFIPGNGYCVMLTMSESGRIHGPWKEQKIIYRKNGGHGMLFRSFEGDLLMALHQPNTTEKERLHIFSIKEENNTLIVEKEIMFK